jgi:cytochrome c biogenesis protein CcmG, thiol:disulfide interchange protein DsbE
MQKAVDKPEKPEPPKRTRLMLLPLALFVSLALLFGYALRSADPSKLPSALLGKPAPVTDLPALATWWW